MAAQEWEYVGKWSTKKSKNPPKPLTKIEKKAFAERMQQTETYGKSRGKITESKNSYSAFIVDEPKENFINPDDQRRDPASHGSSVNSGTRKNKPKKVVEKNRGPITLAQGLALIDINDVETLLEKDQNTFPGSPLLWLKDLVSYFNIKLDAVPELSASSYEKQAPSFPLSEVSKAITKVLRKVLDSTNFGILELFYEHCINSMISDIAKGASTYGYRIFIQILAHYNPKITQTNLSGYLELIKTNQSRQTRCASIMWAVGQSGVKSLSYGLRIWIDVMFPLLAIRPLSTYAVIYLENIFLWHPEIRSANGIITFRDFFPIFDVIYAGSGSLPLQLQKRLLTVYPKIKEIAFTDRKDVTLRNFFPSFLARTSPHAAEPMKAESIQCLLTCLSQDKHCFSLWRQMYTQHFTQSGFLLKCLADGYNCNTIKVDRKILIDTVKTFNVTNEDLATQKKTNFDGYNQCNEACQRLLVNSNKFSFPWFLFLIIGVGTMAGLMVYDVHSNQGKFQGSKIEVFLQQTGTLAFCKSIWEQICRYSILAYKWAEVYVPICYSKMAAVVGPHLIYWCDKLLELRDYLLLESKPIGVWVYDQVVLIVGWLQIKVPTLYASFIEYATPAWQFCFYYIQLSWREIVLYSSLTFTWLQETSLFLEPHFHQFITWCNKAIFWLTN